MIFVEAQFSLGSFARRNGVGLTGENTEVFAHSVCFNRRPPFSRSLVPGDSHNFRSIVCWLSRISPVLSSCHKPQVLAPIVGPVPVDVVNFVRRPLAIDHRHDDTMSPENRVADAPHFVTVPVVCRERLLACPSSIPPGSNVIPLFPKQFPRIRFIAKKLMEGINVW
jgi:hypothetical protein